jgi:uncharacterized protein (TIGR02421 family)
MTQLSSQDVVSIDDEFIEEVQTSLKKGVAIRRKLPGWGRLHMDRQLPFLCVYRRPPDRPDAGTKQLLLGEAAYLFAPGESIAQADLKKLLQAIMAIQIDQFGAALLLELWATPYDSDGEWIERRPYQPVIRIVADEHKAPMELLEKLESNLLHINVSGKSPQVKVEYREHIAPLGCGPLLENESESGRFVIGLEVDPVYRDVETEEVFPFKLREFHHGLAQALKRSFYSFAHSYTTQRPQHYHELGRHAMTSAVWEADRQLSEISERFDILLHVTPVNASHAWDEFQGSGFIQAPSFNYRPRPVDPDIIKRQLYQVPIDRIEDPTLAYIFSAKRDELARQITMIGDRNTPRFIHGSQQVYGEVEDWLLQLAKRLVETSIPTAVTEARDFLDAQSFAEYAREEMAHYKERYSEFSSKVEVREDVTGILVSRGNFLIGSDARVPVERVEATLSHEIGTHVVTYVNGLSQPFHQLHAGMAGYEPLQEGLAVLSEYLVGQLSASRLRILAGRVLAVHSLTQGATFTETFHLLNRDYKFSEGTSFTITMRVYRGGGYTKDAVYLRGLAMLLEYISRGGDYELLFLGKIALEYLPFVEELKWRNVIKAAPLRPRYLDKPEAMERLKRLRQGLTLTQLVEECV